MKSALIALTLILIPSVAKSAVVMDVEQTVYVNSVHDCEALMMRYPNYALAGAGETENGYTCMFYGQAEVEFIQANSRMQCQMMASQMSGYLLVVTEPQSAGVACGYVEALRLH